MLNEVNLLSAVSTHNYHPFCGYFLKRGGFIDIPCEMDGEYNLTDFLDIQERLILW
jgi:hypothetical protein